MNCVFMRLAGYGQPRLVGANTDWVGVRETICGGPGIGEKARGKPALVLGGNGAARIAVYTCGQLFGPVRSTSPTGSSPEADVMLVCKEGQEEKN